MALNHTASTNRKSKFVVQTMSNGIEQNSRCASPGRASCSRRISRYPSLSSSSSTNSCSVSRGASTRTARREILQLIFQQPSKFIPQRWTLSRMVLAHLADMPAPTIGNQRPVTKSSNNGFGKYFEIFCHATDLPCSKGLRPIRSGFTQLRSSTNKSKIATSLKKGHAPTPTPSAATIRRAEKSLRGRRGPSPTPTQSSPAACS